MKWQQRRAPFPPSCSPSPSTVLAPRFFIGKTNCISRYISVWELARYRPGTKPRMQIPLQPFLIDLLRKRGYFIRRRTPERMSSKCGGQSEVIRRPTPILLSPTIPSLTALPSTSPLAYLGMRGASGPWHNILSAWKWIPLLFEIICPCVCYCRHAHGTTRRGNS